jgi:hypothetical protein
MDPDTAIQFHIKGRTITRDFKKTVREIINIPRVLSIHNPDNSRDMDRQMHRQKHTSTRRKDSSRIRFTVKESYPAIHNERNGITGR